MEAFDLIIIGAGHAGCEAGLAAARMGVRTLMLTLHIENIAHMACNPSIGGPAKGHLVREIDALGGEMGRVIDQAQIQMRMLNTKKGPAVQSLRAQADKGLYHREMLRVLAGEANLRVRQGQVEEIVLESGRVQGVVLADGRRYKAQAVILTTGTYLAGRVHVGHETREEGPGGQKAAKGLACSLEAMGLVLRRFKTGTSPRVDLRSLDLAEMTPQEAVPVPFGFSYETRQVQPDQVQCWITQTNDQTKRIIEENLHRAALFSGAIQGPGPRYCPSIESKVVRFPERVGHQIFVEPEGLTTFEVYLNGLSTSLPLSVQQDILATIPGLRKAEIVRPGYAIEYTCLDPTQLAPDLQVKRVPGLYSAGQANGSSGYEEAAGQGLMAGINASLAIRGEEPLVLSRAQGYLGVLIDDLVHKGTDEPYRLLTARAEYRLLLRQGNSDRRLTPIGYGLGLISPERFREFQTRWQVIEAEVQRLTQVVLSPKQASEFLVQQGSTPIEGPIALSQLLKRPEVTYDSLSQVDPDHPDLAWDWALEVETELKYAGYLEKEQRQVARVEKMEAVPIPRDWDWRSIPGISHEAQEKLEKVRPATLGQASRISGVSPSDLSLIGVHLQRARRRGTDE